MALELLRLFETVGITGEPHPLSEANDFSKQIHALVEAKRAKSRDLLGWDGKDTFFWGFTTHIPTQNDPYVGVAIYVGTGAGTDCKVHSTLYSGGYPQLEEIFLLSSEGINYTRKETHRMSQRWLSTGRKDRKAVKHLQELIGDVQKKNPITPA